MRIRYFAWLKHRVGLAEEEIELPAGGGHRRGAQGLARPSATPASPRPWRARAWCAARSTRNTCPRMRRCGPGDEVAFFPPVTGG